MKTIIKYVLAFILTIPAGMIGASYGYDLAYPIAMFLFEYSEQYSNVNPNESDFYIWLSIANAFLIVFLAGALMVVPVLGAVIPFLAVAYHYEMRIQNYLPEPKTERFLTHSHEPKKINRDIHTGV
jgi:hypothetical protein